MNTRTIAALTTAMLIAVTAYAQKVTTDSDPAALFATYKTYAWTKGTPSPNPLGEQRIHAAVDSHLAAKGLTLAAGDPDVIVATHVMTHAQNDIVADGFGPWGFGGGFGGGVATVETYVQGTLIVDLYDATTKKMVWRGVATGTESDKPSRNTEKIDKALGKMFERYPPQGAVR